MASSNLVSVCVPARFVRASPYSMTYQAPVQLNGVVEQCEIEHISIPFTTAKEQELVEFYGVERENLFPFYTAFGRMVSRSIKQMQSLTDCAAEQSGEENTQFYASSNFLPYRFVDIQRKDDRGSDIYIVSQPTVPLLDSPFLSCTGTTLKNVLRIAVMVTRTLKSMQEQGFHLGRVDLGAMCLLNKDDIISLKFGSLLYMGQEGECIPSIPFGFQNEEGRLQSVQSDLYSLSSVLWALLDGQHYMTAPNFSVTPKYASKELEILLLSMAQGEESLDFVHQQLCAILKSVNAGQSENPEIPVERYQKRDNLPSSSPVIHVVNLTNAEQQEQPPEQGESEQGEPEAPAPVEQDEQETPVQVEQSEGEQEPLIEIALEENTFESIAVPENTFESDQGNSQTVSFDTVQEEFSFYEETPFILAEASSQPSPQTPLAFASPPTQEETQGEAQQEKPKKARKKPVAAHKKKRKKIVVRVNSPISIANKSTAVWLCKMVCLVVTLFFVWNLGLKDWIFAIS